MFRETISKTIAANAEPGTCERLFSTISNVEVSGGACIMHCLISLELTNKIKMKNYDPRRQ